MAYEWLETVGFQATFSMRAGQKVPRVATRWQQNGCSDAHHPRHKLQTPYNLRILRKIRFSTRRISSCVTMTST